ncbi:MAG: ATP-binding protein [Planctomycetota bacterium]|nr:ATP-binding protein [Planctomycetota bacterium]
MKSLSTPELAQRVAQELNQPEPQARAVLDRAIEVMKKELQRGNKIELPTFLTVQLKAGQPVAAKSAADSNIHLPAVRRVQMELDEDLRKKLEGTGVYQILLVVPKKNFFTGVMAARLTSPRSEVTVVQGEDEAVASVKQASPDLVVLDVGLAEPSKVCEAVKKSKESSMIAMVRIYAEDEDRKNIKGLEVLCDESISEPFELSELVRLSEAELARFAEERNYFDHQIHFKLQTKEGCIERCNELFGQLLEQSGMPEENREALAIAFREAVDNGARHGNKYNETRNVDVQYFVDREKVTVSVTDDGEGFDTEIYLSRGVGGNPVEAARERNQAGGAGGLGIMLMLRCVDKLEYNYAGNKITLTKFIRRQ